MLELQISIQENCSSLYLFECTGKYDRVLNSCGWGGLNGQTRDAISAYYDIYPPGSADPIRLNLPDDFPSDCKIAYEILPHDLSMEAFVSGLWKFNYFVEMPGETENVVYTATETTLLTKDLECCIASKQLDLDINNFESNEVVEVNNLFALLESAKENACIGKVSKVEKMINYLYAKCRCNC